VQVPQEAVDLCKTSEGFHRVVQWKPVVTAVPYLCPAGFWTIGYGRLCKKEHPAITEETGSIYLAEDMRSALVSTVTLCPVLAVEKSSRLAAIVDFTFNLGHGRLAASTLRKKINARDWEAAADQLKLWVWGGGQKLPGLIIRREREVELLLRGG